MNEEPRVNDRIRISPIRLIDEEGEQLGIVATDEARSLAVERGLDLEAQNGHGRTALEAAYNVRYDSIVDFLIENGADDSLR